MNQTFPDDDAKPSEVMLTTSQEQTRAEYDVSISTAHRFPRSIKQFFARAESLATATPEIAASCEYAKPVGGDRVKGPSARLAEIVAACYGNLRVQARIISENEHEVVAQGVAHDLETNVAHSTEVSVSLLKRGGGRVGPEQVMTARGAACSKARRNAVFLAVPIALCLPIIAAARKVAAGDAKTLPERRKAQLDWFAKQGIKPATVFAWLGVKGEEDIGLEHMADMLAAVNAAKEDGTSLAAIFAQAKEDRLNDNFGGAKTGQPAAQQSATGTPAGAGATGQNGGAQ
jgi:hypothetical protein